MDTGEGRDLRVGTLDTLVVIPGKVADMEGKLGFPGEFLEGRGQEGRQDWQVVDRQDWHLLGTRHGVGMDLAQH